METAQHLVFDKAQLNAEAKIRRIEKKRQQLSEKLSISLMETIDNEFGESVVKIEGNIPKGLPVNQGDSFLFISHDQSRHLHGFHKYPAKFFPELPRWLIEKYSNLGDLVLDPFAGSGTTNLESLMLGRNTVAIDIEEFCRKLIKVKTTALNPTRIDFANRYLIRQLKTFRHDVNYQISIPKFPYRDNWFQDYITLELAFIRHLILMNIEDPDYQDFYLMCMSSIIRSVSNADDNCTRTVIRKRLNKQIHPFMAISKFIEVILINSFKMSEFSDYMSKVSSTIDIPTDSDALNIKYPDDYFDAAITSPPYVNAVDYPRTHQLEIYWLGIENGSLKHIKEKHVGTECVSAKNYADLKHIGIDEVDEVLAKIYTIDKRRSYIAYKYLCDMQKNMQEVYRVLKPGKKYIIAVGNNRIRGTVFESWKYLMPIAERCGFKVDTWFASEVIKHFIKVPRNERIDRDYLIVLQKK